MFRVTFINRRTLTTWSQDDCVKVEATEHMYYVYANGQDLPCEVDKAKWELQSVQLQK